MREMKKGDLSFFYHSVDEKRIVGIVKVIKEAHPDSTDTTGKWECVDFAAVSPVPKPVTLDEIKAQASLSDMVLVNNTRLSVQPVKAVEWKHICKMCGIQKLP